MSKLPVYRYIKEMCSGMGDGYKLEWFECEVVIYRDFGNGYEVEISGLNTRKHKKSAKIYLWKDRSRVVRMVIIDTVTVETLKEAIQSLLEAEGGV